MSFGLIFLVSVVAGFVGAMSGMGGGIVLIPALTFFGIDIKHAIATSIVSVIATSSGSASAYVRDRITNLKVGMFLEMFTIIGALVGAAITLASAQHSLFIVFGLVLLGSWGTLFWQRHETWRPVTHQYGLSQQNSIYKTSCVPRAARPDAWSAEQWNKGIQIDQIAELETLAVRTQNTVYEITVLCGRTGEVLVRGGKFFSEWTPALLAGSTFGGSLLKRGGIYLGMKMEIVPQPVEMISKVVHDPTTGHDEFLLGRCVITTSPVQTIGVVPLKRFARSGKSLIPASPASTASDDAQE